MEVDYKKLAASCDRTKDCSCPVIVYENEDGFCRHKACEGPKEECGEAIAVYP